MYVQHNYMTSNYITVSVLCTIELKTIDENQAWAVADSHQNKSWSDNMIHVSGITKTSNEYKVVWKWDPMKIRSKAIILLSTSISWIRD